MIKYLSLFSGIGAFEKVIKTHCWTITTKQNRIPNAGVIQKDEGYRFLTPLECFRLQGFDEKIIGYVKIIKFQIHNCINDQRIVYV